MLLQCIANMAACEKNTEILLPTIPYVVKRLNSSLEMERTVAFQALTNLSYTITQSLVDFILPAIPICLKRFPLTFYHFAGMLISNKIHKFIDSQMKKKRTIL